MEKLRKFFGGTDMTWKKVVLLAIATAVLTAVINLIPALQDTSLQDIAVYPDAWFLFALFIIVNCKKWWEAALKCFVFFLISQPLIYLIEVPFNPMGWELFGYYGYWFRITLLTLPGAAIAYQVKRQDWLSVLVLSVATWYLAYMCIYHFPHHLLSSVFCLALAVFFVLVLLRKRAHRIAALCFIAAVLLVSGFFTFFNVSGTVQELYLGEGEWSAVSEDESIVTVEMTDEGVAAVTTVKNGSTIIDFTASDGTVQSFVVVVDGKDLMISPID